MSRCRLSAQARRDLREIHDYIARHNAPAAAKFIDFLLEEGHLLARSRELGERRDDLAPGLRCFTSRGYVFLYRVTTDGVQIVRVIHGARDIEALFRPNAE